MEIVLCVLWQNNWNVDPPYMDGKIICLAVYLRGVIAAIIPRERGNSYICIHLFSLYLFLSFPIFLPSFLSSVVHCSLSAKPHITLPPSLFPSSLCSLRMISNVMKAKLSVKELFDSDLLVNYLTIGLNATIPYFKVSLINV